MKKNKVIDLTLFLIIYIFAYAIGFLSSLIIENMLLKTLVFDVVSTIVIWIFSLILKNSSIYDAYWSLTPFVILTYVLLTAEYVNIYHILFYVALSFWSFRLTINWITTFSDRKWEDWRYKMYRENHPKLWPIINFFGIQMMPTLFVYSALVPAILLFAKNASPLSLLGSSIIVVGTLLELFADRQMHAFLRTTTEKVTCRRGLWKYSRHPNYLGEILIWVGVYCSLLLTDYSLWFTFIGIIIMLFLFIVVSIPMMEKRQVNRRSDYKDYQRKTSILLILPNKK